MDYLLLPVVTQQNYYLFAFFRALKVPTPTVIVVNSVYQTRRP